MSYAFPYLLLKENKNETLILILFLIKIRRFHLVSENKRTQKKEKRKMSKRNLKWQEIKPLAKEILYNSIAQAILKIIDTPFIALKIFLFIFVLTSTACSAYLVVQSFLAYFAYEVATTTRTLSETPAPFPKITIVCIPKSTIPGTQ
jgi:hypothetical protein